MSDGALTVLDGSHLRAVDLTLPDADASLTGAQVLDLAVSKASSSLFGLSLPQSLKSSALRRISLQEDDGFRSTELDRAQALKVIGEYITAIADELKDDPLVVSVLDGYTIRLFLEDEDDFAMLAENLFTDLDVEDKGKINKNEIQNALVHMGVEMGVPPVSEFPPLSDILTKHEADGDEELGQAQFAQLLQPVLQELAEALAKKHVVFIQSIKIVNGSKLRKLLADEKQLNNVVEKILHEDHHGKDGLGNAEKIRSFLVKNGQELGLPPYEAEAVDLLYDAEASYAGKLAGSGISTEELVPGGGDCGGNTVTVQEGEQRKIGAYYQEMLKSNPDDPLLLRNYGKFLHEVEKDAVGAEECYCRAILRSPGDGDLLSLYGKLIWETQRDEERAKSYFDQAVSASPNDCMVLGSFASFMWEAEEDEDEDDNEEINIDDETQASSVPALVPAF